ncbi:uncharacterized protein LOC128751152 [Synchiropus splendidus]|uniref:uncharacterized protein LOC128751152 n=1 Tax=Synchiropus splendidus TaxID=270530 RepID=UPI00237D8576|nr:uncharacterized protein LOC128751152 [Synchiropus splendidus]
MESFERFRLAVLQEKEGFKTVEPVCSFKACSVIRFHGRPVLAPLLNGQQRQQMRDYRRRAAQLEEARRHRLKIPPPQSPIQPSRSPAEKLPAAALNGYTLVTDSPGLEHGSGLEIQDAPQSPVPVNGYKEVQRKEKGDGPEEDLNLDFLLRRSREYVKREQSQSKSLHSDAQMKTEKSPCSPFGDNGVEFGFSLHHSPVGSAPTQIQTLYEPKKSLSPSLLGQSIPPSSPESVISLRPQKRKPRPFSTGNIQVSFPISPTDLVPRSPVRSVYGPGPGERDKAPSARSPEDTAVGHVNRGYSRCDSSPVEESISPSGHAAHLTSNFRRRCHTLDSQPQPEHIDRSQERLPRFMAGVPMLTPSRRNALNKSRDSPSPSVLRSCGTPDLKQVHDAQSPANGRGPAAASRNGTSSHCARPEENQWSSQTLEEMQRRLEDEHALQMSLLLVEQEKEQLRLRQELEEAERRRRDEWSAGDECGMSPRLSPSHTISDLSPGAGNSSPVRSSAPSPSVHPPVFLWGSNWNPTKSRARLSQVLTAEQQKAFCRVGAITRGFLTRRLLKTDKVRNLRQTVLDTREFISSFHTEAPQKMAFSAQDLTLHERVKAQLRAALFDVHEIFFEIPLMERLALLQQDRELRTERKLREVEKAKCLRDRGALSSATQRSLDRKKRVGESPVPTRKIPQKPKSPTTNRVMKCGAAQKSPVPGQLNRQGSWYKKTPEERVRRSDLLKKQHSLG